MSDRGGSFGQSSCQRLSKRTSRGAVRSFLYRRGLTANISAAYQPLVPDGWESRSTQHAFGARGMIFFS